MDATDILASLGFTDASVVNEQRGKVVVRIRTSLGWTYEKFSKNSLEAEITAWADGRSPG